MASKSEIIEALGISGDVDSKSLDVLIKAIKAEQLPGFDYIKFKQSLKALSAMDIDPTTAIKSAFATASTLGVTKDKLIKTAKHYQSILQREKQQFDQAATNQITQRIAAKEEEILKFDQQIQECEEQIESLTKLIEQLKGKLTKAKEEKSTAATKIKEAKEKFDSSYALLAKTIEEDIHSMEQEI